MSLLELEHYTDIALNKVTRVLAIVALGALFPTTASLYLAYHPTPFSTQVFPTEKEALIWVQ